MTFVDDPIDRTVTRRSVLGTLAAAAVAAARPLVAQHAPSSFRGRNAGDQRDAEGVKLCWCPPGHFAMGSPPDEIGHRPDEAQVQVTITKGFWMAKFETTQGQWKRVAGEFPDKGPAAEWGEGDDVPVYWVSFDEAEGFCKALTSRARAAGTLAGDWEFRLPTEAQWECACRAGTTTATAFGDQLRPDRANLKGQRAVAVGRYPANRWGLCDMHGNIFEWCRDWYHARLPGGTDPDLHDVKGTANRDGTYSRVRRGGAWTDEAWACRSAFRLRYEPERRADHIGFRIVLVQP